jgi:5-methylcytosine-specific restriction protein A
MTDGPCRGKHDLERFRFCRTFNLHYPEERGPDGQRLCRWCGQQVGGRIYWCSDKCVSDYQIASGKGGTIQAHVQKRDQGVCAGCGVDTMKLEEVIRKLYDRGVRGNFPWHPRTWGEAPELYNARIKRRDLQRTKYRVWLRRIQTKYPWAFYRHRVCGDSCTPLSRNLWEADHIVPVVEGGGACGLENFRTLCLPCHKAETKALRKRLAKNQKAGF